MTKQISSVNAPKAIGPYSQAIEAGNFIFCSGQIALSPKTGEIISGEIAEQTRQVLKNLQVVLEKAGVNLSAVIKTDIFVKNINDFKTVNEIYSEFFSKDPKPARQTVEISNLPKNALVEISCIAFKK